MLNAFKKLKLWQRIIVCIFLAVQISFYVLYLATVINQHIAYTMIVLCFVFALIIFIFDKQQRSLSALLLCIGLFITCIADIFMGFLNMFEVGISVFSIVQIVYAVRIHSDARNRQKTIRAYNLPLLPKAVKISLIVRAAAIVLLTVLAVAFFWGNPIFTQNVYLWLIAIFYIVNSVVNLVFASLAFNRNPLFSLGIGLLLICDIFIGINFFGWIPQVGYLAAVNIWWIFYLLSQPLMALSVFAKSQSKLGVRSICRSGHWSHEIKNSADDQWSPLQF